MHPCVSSCLWVNKRLYGVICLYSSLIGWVSVKGSFHNFFSVYFLSTCIAFPINHHRIITHACFHTVWNARKRSCKWMHLKVLSARFGVFYPKVIVLPLWGQNKMVTVLQMALWNYFFNENSHISIKNSQENLFTWIRLSSCMYCFIHIALSEIIEYVSWH